MVGFGVEYRFSLLVSLSTRFQLLESVLILPSFPVCLLPFSFLDDFVGSMMTQSSKFDSMLQS